MSGRRRLVARLRGSDRDERGATLVLVAFLVTVMVLMIGLTVDGGRSYAARRQAQNGADVASMAGAEALYAYLYAVANHQFPAPAVSAAVLDKLSQNGLAGPHSCTYIDRYGTSLGVDCASAPPDGSAGVSVRGTVSEPTSFMRIAGATTISVSASARATIQPIAGVAAPFIICGNPAVGGYSILDTNGIVNATNALSVGVFDLEGPQVPDCGDPSAKFKGKADPTSTFVRVESYTSITQGNGYSSSTHNQVAGQVPCPNGGPFTDCYMLLPIANGPGGMASNPLLFVTDFGVFHVTVGHGGNPRYSAQFVAPAATLSGPGVPEGSCSVGNQACVVQLLG